MTTAPITFFIHHQGRGHANRAMAIVRELPPERRVTILCARPDLVAGFDRPVEIVELSDWDMVERFVADHIPDEHHVNDDGSTHNDWYGNANIEAAIEMLVEYWGKRVRELPAVAYNIDRLGVKVVGR